MKIITTHYINGRFVESKGKEIFDLTNPTNKKIIGQVTLGNEEDARDAICAAKKAFKTYSKTTLIERSQYLQQLHDAIIVRADEHVAIRTEEYGGVYRHSKSSIAGAAKIFLNMKKSINEIPFRKELGLAEVKLKPLGVASLITPWNSAIFMICNKVAPALAAGCTVVIKPSELSALQVQLLMECFDAACLPPGVINLVYGRGDVVGSEIATNPDVTKVSFTGSTAVGKLIMRNASETMKRVTLELGGKSAHIFLDDVDLKKAIPFALTAGFMNNGQACIAGTRVLVPEHMLDDVKSAFLKTVPKLRVGNPLDEDTVLGPMVSEQQYNRVQHYIRKGIEEGADILIGGEGHPEGLESGYFVKPTIFVNVTNDMTIAREEIFGPVLSVITYKTEEEAIRIANDSTYGLHCWISTTNLIRGKAIADHIEAGIVMVNDLYDLYDDAGVPAGGFKQSGIGSEFGVYGIEEYLQTQAIFPK